MVPIHIWLFEAHVEAPTAGSVILAGIPLKLGTYGFLRFSIPMFPKATLCSTPFIYTLSAIAIIYTSLTFAFISFLPGTISLAIPISNKSGRIVLLQTKE